MSCTSSICSTPNHNHNAYLYGDYSHGITSKILTHLRVNVRERGATNISQTMEILKPELDLVQQYVYEMDGTTFPLFPTIIGQLLPHSL